MTTIFEGYTIKSNKAVEIVLDTTIGCLYVIYKASGRKVRYNLEYYTEESDFSFLLNDFRKA